MRALKTGCRTSSVASAVWHVAPSCWNQILPISSSSIFVNKKFVHHGPITIAIDCYSLCLLISEEKCPNYASRPKSAPNSDSFWVRWLFKVCVRVFCAPNATILIVYIPAKIKMSFIWKDDCFLVKIGIFCKSIAGQKLIGWSIGFKFWTNWTLHAVITRSLCKIRLIDVSEMFNCWERRRFTYTFCHSSQNTGPTIQSRLRTTEY